MQTIHAGQIERGAVVNGRKVRTVEYCNVPCAEYGITGKMRVVFDDGSFAMLHPMERVGIS